MKKLIIYVFAVLSAVSLLSINAFADDAPTVSARCAVVTDVNGNVLYSKNADEKMLIASTTKIMTALVVIENCSLDETFVIKPEHTAVEGSSMYLKNGEEVTVLEVLYGLLLESGNDAAAALAYHVGGSIDGFAEMMNNKAAALGLENTSFRNPHGLDAEGHYSTAHDLAVIMAEAMKNDDFRRITSTKSISIGGRTLSNHNKLLSTCEGVSGGKTGYTKSAGRSLVSSCERDGLSLICVTLNAPDDWTDHTALYDWAYANYEASPIIDSILPIEEIPVISGTAESVGIITDGTIRLTVEKGKTVTTKTILPKFVYAPIAAGDAAGRIDIFIDNEFKGSVALVFSNSVQRSIPKNNIFRLFENSGLR